MFFVSIGSVFLVLDTIAHVVVKIPPREYDRPPTMEVIVRHPDTDTGTDIERGADALSLDQPSCPSAIEDASVDTVYPAPTPASDSMTAQCCCVCLSKPKCVVFTPLSTRVHL